MNKKTLILGGVLLALIALAYFYQGPLKKWQNNLGKPANILVKTDLNIIDKIEVISTDSTVILTKQSGVSFATAPVKWKYNNSQDFYVDPAIMSEILDSLKVAQVSEMELVSNNPDRKSEFKTDGAGLAVKIYQADKKVADFVVGERTSNYGGTYVSTLKSQSTYSVKTDLKGVFEQTEWRDLTIFSTAKENIKKLRFQYPNREFTIELKDNQWIGTLPEKFTVNKEKIDALVAIMTNLKASKIPEQNFSNTGLDKHLIIIQATGEAVDNTLMIGIGEGKSGLFYAKKGESDNIYLIEKADRDKLDKWIWQLK